MTINGTVTSGNTSNTSTLGTGTILDNDTDVLTQDDIIIADVSGEPASINILDNDANNTNPTTINLIPGNGMEGNDTDGDGDIDTIVVPGEGTWSVDETGVVTFTPEDGFTEDPTPISYTVENTQGNVSEPTQIEADYPQNATDANDDSITAPIGNVSINILENDTDNENDTNVSSVNLIAPENIEANATDTDGDGDIDQIIVPGEGVWNVDNDGVLVFTPEPDFTGDPTPIGYTVSDDTGAVSEPATVNVNFEQILRDDSATALAHKPAKINILENDDEVIASTVSLQGAGGSTQTDTDGDGDIDEVIVPGEGIWNVDNEGTLIFTPEEHFIGDPTPITYTAMDEQGNTLDAATVTIDYVSIGFLIEPVAVDDNLTILADRVHTRDVSENDTPGEGGKDSQRYQLLDPKTGNRIAAGESVELDYGVLSMDENGIYSYNPFANAVGTDEFRYIMEDSVAQTSEANVVLSVDCASSQKSDSGSSLDGLSLWLMLLFTGLTGLYFIRKEEEVK
jgi:CshA-type fibril repeat protein